MRYPHPHHNRDEVKVAVLADEMRADNAQQWTVSDIFLGLAAVASACALFWLGN